MILDIEREWAKEPGWFGTLGSEHQALLLAERRVRAKEAEEARKKAEMQARTRAAKGRKGR